MKQINKNESDENETYCKWCGSKVKGEYEEILGEDELEEGGFVEEYQIVCIECINKAMRE